MLNKIAVFSTIGLLAFPVTAQAQNDEVLRGPHPEWTEISVPMDVPDDADGPSFLRRQDTVVYLSDAGETIYQNQMIRILNSQALNIGNISIVWNPAAGAPTVHALKIHRDGETLDVLDGTTFQILRREDQLETAMLDGMLTATLQVPDLRVGDDLELAFSSPSHDPTLQHTNSGLLFVSQTPPDGRIRIGLKWNRDEPPNIKYTSDLHDNIEREANSIDLKFDNASNVTPPADAPPRYSWMRILEYTDFANWEQLSVKFWDLFNTASQLEAASAVREEAARIARVHPTKRAQANAALKLVQRQVRYVYVGLNGGNLKPATAEETWARRYGDCKGKTALLLALLRELGIEAQPVLVNNALVDDGLDERLPNPGMFDHVLVKAELGDETLWMDGTLPEVIEARAEPFLSYRFVLPLSETGTTLKKMPAPKLNLPTEMGLYEIDARAGFDQPANKKTIMAKRGVEGLQEYFQFSALTSNQLKGAISNALLGGEEWETIDSVKYRFDRETTASILTIEGTGKVDWQDEGGGYYSLFLPRGGFQPPQQLRRPSSQDQTAPYFKQPSYSCHATSVRLPTKTKLRNWDFNSTFATELYGRTYYRMMEKRNDGTIRMVRGSRAHQPEISPEQAMRDNEMLDDFDNSKAWIDYSPYRTSQAKKDLRPVPATYEIDWLSKSPPCLPIDPLNGN